MLALKFDYVNWRGERHEYIIVPQGEPITEQYTRQGQGDTKTLYLHGQLITRDGDPRIELGPSRRRSFEISRLENLEVVLLDPEEL